MFKQFRCGGTQMQNSAVAAAPQDGCDELVSRAVEELPGQRQKEGIKYIRHDAAAVGEAGDGDHLEDC